MKAVFAPLYPPSLRAPLGSLLLDQNPRLRVFSPCFAPSDSPRNAIDASRFLSTDSDDLKDATKYERERNGAREFKGGSPLATSKGSTLVAREGLLNSIKKN